MPVPQSILQSHVESARYAKCVEVSKRIRWDIDRDVIRGRSFDFAKRFLPDGLSKVDRLDFLSANEQRLLSQIQGRTYANMFGLVERFIAAKVLDVSREYALGDQNALQALVRFGDEEIKHQELFRRIERMCAGGMPGGYTFVPEPNAVASAVLAKSTWAVLALTCHIELFVLAHYRREHRHGRPCVRAVEGRVPAPREGGIAARDPGRDGMGAREREAHVAGARCGRGRPDRAGRRRRRHPAGPVARRIRTTSSRSAAGP